MPRRIALIPTLCLVLALPAGCSGKKDETPPAPTGTLISVTAATVQDVPVVLKSIGRLESRAAPLVAAEIDGRVLELAVDEGAEITEVTARKHKATKKVATKPDMITPLSGSPR